MLLFCRPERSPAVFLRICGSFTFSLWASTAGELQFRYESQKTRPALWAQCKTCLCQQIRRYLSTDWCGKLLLHPVWSLWSFGSGYMESLTFHFLAAENYPEVQHGERVQGRNLPHIKIFKMRFLKTDIQGLLQTHLMERMCLLPSLCKDLQIIRIYDKMNKIHNKK